MFRDLINKGKEIADKVTNIVLNFTEAETKVREATSDEAWGPHGRLMNQIAEYTYCHSTFLEVMGTLWKRMHSEYASNWRRVYKSLILLDFLLKNGSEQVLLAAREHIYDIRTLESFHYHDEYGKDQGINVRLKVQEVINLIQDPEKLREEREKARSNRHLYTGYGGSDRREWYNSDDSYYGNRYSYQDHDRYDSPPRVSRCSNTSRIETENNFRDSRTSVQQHQTLGDFDEWHVGRERGVVDDVIEQIREAWDVAKLSTKDIFFKKDCDVDIRESNPRMVSEEMYEFPEEAVEVDGTFESDVNPTRNEYRYNTQSNSQPSRQGGINSREVSPVHRRRDPSNRVEVFERTKQSATKPRPPSMDLMGSWDELPSAPSSTAPNAAVDLLGMSDSLGQGTVWPKSTELSQQQQWPFSQPVAPSAPGTSVGDKSLLDADFGDFLGANETTVNPVKPATNQINFTGVDRSQPNIVGFNASKESVGANTFTPLWPGSPNSNAPSTLTPIPAGNLFPDNHGATVASSSTPSKNTATTTQSHTNVQVGNTWKELGALGINLDNLAQPDRLNQRSAPGPSLRELQQTRQKVTSTPAPTTIVTPGQSSFTSPLSSPSHAPPMMAASFHQGSSLNTVSHPTSQPVSQNLVDFNLL